MYGKRELIINVELISSHEMSRHATSTHIILKGLCSNNIELNIFIIKWSYSLKPIHETSNSVDWFQKSRVFGAGQTTVALIL